MWSQLLRRSALIVVIVLLGVTVVACGGDNEDDDAGTTAEATETPGAVTSTPEDGGPTLPTGILDVDGTPGISRDASPDASPNAGPEGSPRSGDVAVPVDLNEFEISMPDSLPAGETTFAIANTGTAPHSFVIEGEGIEESVAETLEPGESATLTVDLEPGTYDVYCPVGNHEDRGMHLELTVTD